MPEVKIIVIFLEKLAKKYFICFNWYFKTTKTCN